MGYEEIQIRVTRDGYVQVDARGLPAGHVRALSEHLEEVFGPRVQILGDPKDAPPQLINLDAERMAGVEENAQSSATEEETQQERRRLRLME